MGPLERFDEDAALHRKLRGVVGVLVVTAAAAGVVFAARSDAGGRGLEYGVEHGFDVAATVVGDCGFDQLARQCKRDEDRFAGEIRRSVGWHARQRCAAVDRFFHAQLHATRPVAYRRD